VQVLSGNTDVLLPMFSLRLWGAPNVAGGVANEL
jgi:hypothetical protein